MELIRTSRNEKELIRKYRDKSGVGKEEET